MGNDGFFNGQGFQYCAHFQVIRDNQAVVTEPLSQDICNQFPRKGSGSVVMSDGGIAGMRDEYEGHLAAQNSIGNDVLCPKFGERLLDDGKVMMGVEVSFAQSRKVFATTQDSRVA